jgi:predicted PurR-regulated permease PerM
VVIAAFGVLGGIGLWMAPLVAEQSTALAQQTAAGVTQIQHWLAGPPLNLRLANGLGSIIGRVRQSTPALATGVLSGLTTVGSILLTAVLTVVLAFLFVKDGARFLPWLSRWLGNPAGPHLEEVLRRAWRALSSFIRMQALVGLIDAFLIGIALFGLGVPLALPLAVLIFFGVMFVPIAGSIVTGALAVLIALVGHGVSTALIALGVVLIVMQLEGNVFSPILQGHKLRLHPAVVLLSVTAGGDLFGVAGALLAVPFAAVTAEVLRYLSEQIDTRLGAVHDHRTRPTDATPTDRPASLRTLGDGLFRRH